MKCELASLPELENSMTHENVKPLTGELRGLYRLRIGNYRIVFALIIGDRTIAVVNIAPRGDAY